MNLIISNRSDEPIYIQLKRQIKEAILNGELQEGEACPSLRTVAKELRISVLTVSRAYAELEAEGFVKNVQGRGCFVMTRGQELLREQLVCQIEGALIQAVKAARLADLSSEELHDLLDVLLEMDLKD
ncbi:MAG TPA: GntR family transcriptional regulator [Firmicutes bacterium]|nr:GntR family transcriptional regulator [Bacillota bacterium]HHT43589.1 GntR family transcriptional regulator [Bacillota bacterium]